MIPPFTSSGLLPEGIHQASWLDLETILGRTATRKRLLSGLLSGLKALRLAGCTRAYVDGSFVTDKAQPNDIDVCYESESMDFSLLDATLKDFSNRRAAQKAKYGCEFFEAEAQATPDGILFLDFFQMTKDGYKKGLVSINFQTLPEEVSK